MVFDKSCPGSKRIREPVPENFVCPSCGREVEIWTDETKATCPACKTRVFRERQMSCIDWCPYAKECVGPEVYERLKPSVKEDLSGSALDALRREHDRVLETIGLLRGVSLCFKFDNLGTQSPLRDRGVGHLEKVIEFFDKDVQRHFRLEEDVLFPAINRHLEAEKNPTQLLLREHAEWRRLYQNLKEKTAQLKTDGSENADAVSAEIQRINTEIEHLLREHIKKENESLLPLAGSLLGPAELEEISQKWRSLEQENV